MAWIMDTYSQQKGFAVPGVVTGKPIEIGGSLGRREATGRGVITCAAEASRQAGFALEGARVVVQGYGNVGSVSAKIAAEMGARVIGISDVKCGLHNPNGVDLSAVDAWIAQNRYLEGCPAGERVSNAELLTLPCDILIPAAIQNQITEYNAGALRCRMVVEGANGPTSVEADRILAERGIVVVPDVVANAGGVTVSYFEWVQDAQQFFWSEEEVNQRLIRLMQRAYRDIATVAQQHKVDLRTAALMRGVSRVAEAKRLRGVFP
jgi:glutamate dehydrogenase/leucine dehydrogenase